MRLELKEMPEIIRLELTNICTLRCPHCRHHSPKLTLPENMKEFYRIPRELTFEQIEKIIDEVAPYKPSFTLNVANEPLVAKTFSATVRKLKKKNLAGTFNTNGFSLTEELARLLVKINFDSINFSVDALTPQTLKKVRGVDRLDELISKVDLMLKVRGDSVYPRIGVTFVKQRANYRELDDFVKFWGKKVDVIRITGFLMENRPELALIPDTDMACLPQRIPCQQLFRDIVIRANGDVSPCVICTENPELFVGNIFRDGGVRAVWNSELFKKMRDLHNQGRWDELPFCKKCDYWLETFEMKEEVRGGFLIRTPSPYSVFYNVIDRLGTWNRNLHDRQGT